MFAKLLKYDMRSVKRFGLPILIALAGATVLGAGGLVGSILTLSAVAEQSPMLASLMGSLLSLLLFAVIFILGAAGVAMQIAIYYDYYRSLVTDEAYLTFTLPVKPREILGSKLLNSCIWGTVSGVAVIVAILILILSGVIAGGVLPDFLMVLKQIPRLLASLSAGAWLLLVLLCLLGIAYAVNARLLYFLSIFFGSVIAKKYKLLSVIGCVFGANMIYSTVVQTVFTLLSFTAALSGEHLLTTLNILAAVGILLLSGLSVLFFKLTEYMMKNKLNLA